MANANNLIRFPEMKAFTVLTKFCIVLMVASSCATKSPTPVIPSASSTPNIPFSVPSGAVQAKMVRAIRAEMERLDGEGLIPRKNRAESFRMTTDHVAKEALQNKTAFDFYRSFARLGATYPNLHADTQFPERLLKQIQIPGPYIEDWASIYLSSEILSPTHTRIVVSEIKDDAKLSERWSGAEVIAINHRPIRSWLDENFLFCKRALKAQCDGQLDLNIVAGVLSWKGGPLTYTVRKNKKQTELTVHFKKPQKTEDADRFAKKQCDWRSNQRYPGFKLIHKGYFACLFEKESDPSTVILRISSFQYERGRGVSPGSPIRNLSAEVDALKTVWIPKSESIHHLILDLIDNGGGNSPMEYYQLLFQRPFLEQYVRFKKIPEFEDPILRGAMFWKDPAHELWFQKQKTNGKWKKLKIGNFTDPTPQFCADETHPCGEIKFLPFTHRFNGKISLLVNQNCVSSCDGMVWMLSSELGAKLYGFYPAADSAYSRLRIDAIRDTQAPDGFVIKIHPQRAELNPDALVSQTVAVSRSSDVHSKTLAGKPMKLTKFVPKHWDSDYHRDVLWSVLGKH